MGLPIRIDSNGGSFSLEHVDEGMSHQMHEEYLRGRIAGAYVGSWHFALPRSLLLQMADVIYRYCGQVPRDQQRQVVRVELVAAAPPAPVDQHEQTEPLDEVGQIRKRMLEGR
jgi:hypothetical protein